MGPGNKFAWLPSLTYNMTVDFCIWYPSEFTTVSCVSVSRQKTPKKKKNQTKNQGISGGKCVMSASQSASQKTRSHLLTTCNVKRTFRWASSGTRILETGTPLPASRLGHSSSGTVKWYNIEIYFYADADADDDDHLALEKPVAMALLLAMPMPVRNCLVRRNAVFAVSQCQLAKCQSSANSSSSQWQHRRSGRKILDEL